VPIGAKYHIIRHANRSQALASNLEDQPLRSHEEQRILGLELFLGDHGTADGHDRADDAVCTGQVGEAADLAVRPILGLRALPMTRRVAKRMLSALENRQYLRSALA
jgi:hypothetical protein